MSDILKSLMTAAEAKQKLLERKNKTHKPEDHSNKDSDVVSGQIEPESVIANNFQNSSQDNLAKPERPKPKNKNVDELADQFKDAFGNRIHLENK